MNEKPVLVSGATGYVGGRLVPLLLDSGRRVRVMGRSLDKMACRPWAAHPRIELVQADMLDASSLEKAARGCWAAFYLIHSMKVRKDFAQTDRKAAQNMVHAAQRAGLSRIIYLGGLGKDDPSLSEHLRSRTEVARILQSGPVPVTFLRAAVILGAGSASFEMMRYLVDRLPVMTTPRWVHTPCQPIAIRNVLHYLNGCLDRAETTGETFDIGGPDVLTYGDLLRIYASEAGLPKRWIIPVPVLTPKLSAYWVHLVTPIPSSMAHPLIQGLRNPVVCEENRIRTLLPQRLLTCREAIRLALQKIDQQAVETCWSDAGGLQVPEWVDCGDAPYAGGKIFECGYRTVIGASPQETWESVTRLGGVHGWYYANFFWLLRGAMDRLLGGVGLRRGRRDPYTLYVGDALDFWRVLEVKAPQRLDLLAEMKLPGEATLTFRLYGLGPGRTEIQLLSRFFPRGLFGLIYWHGLYPFHQRIFKGMLKSMAAATGKPVLSEPARFAPRRQPACHVNSNP